MKNFLNDGKVIAALCAILGFAPFVPEPHLWGKLKWLAGGAVGGGGLASAVLAALMQAGREQGAQEVMLRAQASAVGFYRRLGYRRCGPVFEEAGIPHQEMRINL